MLIAHGGGPTPVINSSLLGAVREAKRHPEIETIYGARFGAEGILAGDLMDLGRFSDEELGLLSRTPASALGSCRRKLTDADYPAVLECFKKFNIRYFFYNGGNDSMDTCHKVYQLACQSGYELRVIGIPKTIDNDINFVPQSFGFDTAVDKATEAIGCAHVEAVGTPNGIGIVKLMGRESGFIAAQSALALREANFVLIPEAPFQLHGDGGLLPALERRLKLRGHAVIIAAEGAGQHLLQQNEARDASGNPVLSDVGSLLRTSIVDYFHGKMPISIKYIDPSYIIRSVPANANDRVYCGFLGQHAVHAAMAGRTEMVVAKIMDRYVHIPLDLVTKKRRKLDIRSGLWRAVLESTGQGELTGMLPEGEKA